MMARAGRKRAAIATVSVVALVALAALYSYGLTKREAGPAAGSDAPAERLTAPEYMYSFAGPDDDRMRRPLGVLVDGPVVLVTDGLLGRVGVYTLEGRLVRTFGEGTLEVPLYIAEHPLTGEYWVSDRRRGTLSVFGPSGDFRRDFTATVPADPAAAPAASGSGWSPAALDFDADGTLYVTDIAGQRVLRFGPDGRFVRADGRAGVASHTAQYPDLLMFPNGVKVSGDRVWVADSNNRRLKVCAPAGDCERLITSDDMRLPRGLDLLSGPQAGPAGAERVVVMDAFGHDGLIFDATGARLTSFGEPGALEGQFANPNDVAVSEDGLLFVADTSNARVQVWGWSGGSSSYLEPRNRWWLAGLGLLGLPLVWLALRRRRFLVTRDFMEAMLRSGRVPAMPGRRRLWFAEPKVRDAVAGVSQGDVVLSELLARAAEYSASDVASMGERLGVDRPTAVTVTIAQQVDFLCTEDPELRRVASVLGIKVLDAERFVERFARRKAPVDEPPA